MSETFTHKCPNCGGPLFFYPNDQKFHCEYCLSTFIEEEMTSYEQTASNEEYKQTNNGPASDMNQTEEEMDLFLCDNCGAQIVATHTTAATFCYFCHNPVVLSGRLSGTFLPEKVLPFAIEKKEAVDAFLAWTKKKWFIPRNFFTQEQIEKLSGVYFPYWVVDATIDGKLQATGTTIRVWRIGDIEYTETKKFKLKREGQMTFNDVVQNALAKNQVQEMINSVQPFPVNKAVTFKTHYLAGFQAEKRDIDYEHIQTTVHNELRDYATSLLKNTASEYSLLSNIRSQHTIDSEENHYFLLPVWLVTYRSNRSSEKNYYYAMNGQTGKISGVLPIDYKRLAGASFLVFLVVLFLGLTVGWFI